MPDCTQSIVIQLDAHVRFPNHFQYSHKATKIFQDILYMYLFDKTTTLNTGHGHFYRHFFFSILFPFLYRIRYVRVFSFLSPCCFFYSSYSIFIYFFCLFLQCWLYEKPKLLGEDLLWKYLYNFRPFRSAGERWTGV